MFIEIYVRRGVAYIPTTGVTESGLYVGLDPVEVVRTSDSFGLRTALERAAQRGNPRAPEPGRSGSSVVLRHAGSRSWGEFERDASLWALDEKDGRIRVIPHRKAADGGWEEDPQQIEVLPPTAGIPEAAERLASLVG